MTGAGAGRWVRAITGDVAVAEAASGAARGATGIADGTVCATCMGIVVVFRDLRIATVARHKQRTTQMAANTTRRKPGLAASCVAGFADSETAEAAGIELIAEEAGAIRRPGD
jgi:hypothetical protein